MRGAVFLLIAKKTTKHHIASIVQNAIKRIAGSIWVAETSTLIIRVLISATLLRRQSEDTEELRRRSEKLRKRTEEDEELEIQRQKEDEEDRQKRKDDGRSPKLR